MKDYRWTEQEQELKRNGFRRDMAFTTEEGAKECSRQLEKRNYKTAIAEGSSLTLASMFGERDEKDPGGHEHETET